MWRAFFLAIGLSLIILGGECLMIERVVLAGPVASQASDEQLLDGSTSTEKTSRVIVPPEWSPWSFFSTGAVVMIYSFTIPSRVKG